MKRVSAILGTLLLLCAAVVLTANAAYPLQDVAATRKSEVEVATRPVVRTDVKHDLSPSLYSVRPVPMNRQAPDVPVFTLQSEEATTGQVVDTAVQRVLGPLEMPTPIENFDGIFNHFGPIPPDTNGDVGPNHYVQSVNSGFQIWDKNGNSLYGPTNINALWQGFGGLCESYNNGDPVNLYDPLADRWLMSQFAFASTAGPTYECVAISTSADPMGSYHRYAFLSGPTNFQDYPHLGVWPDGYYMATNEFGTPSGGGYFALERSQMLEGEDARLVYFHTSAGGHLPSDLDGPPPPAGSPNYFLRPSSPGGGQLQEYKFAVNWTNPLSSTLTGPITINVTPWNSTVCNATRGQCVDQPSTTAKLETIAGRFMHRLAYRNLDGQEILVGNHTVNASTTTPGIAGVRWYEIRDPNGTPSVFQQSTYAPDDGIHRWMGSIAMDRAGNIAMGYSASSTTVYPSVRYAGRLASDPVGVMAQGEGIMHAGTGSEDFPNTGRWGDYSNISVDPADDCTFWFTTEYFQTTGLRNWRTRIGSFKFPSCTAVEPTPTNTATPCPITFTDVVTTDYFYVPVQYLYCGGIISGYADNTFRPYNSTTRSQMVKIVVLGFAIPLSTNETPLFEDVPTTNPFFVFVQTAAEEEIVSGYTCGGEGEPCVPPGNRPYFRPFNLVTRGQLAKIVVVAAGWSLINPTTPTFSDVPLTDPFYTFIETAYCHQIISGYADGTFRPGANATRGQISKIVYLAIVDAGGCVTPLPSATPTAVPTLCPGGESVTGSITMSDTLQTGRLGLGSPVSTCAAPKTCGTLSDSLMRHYDSYTYTNSTGSAQCITVSIVQGCSDNAIQSAAYLGSYDPANLCTNYLADGGASGQTFSYSFNVPAGATYVIAVFEVSPNIGCETYTMRVSPCAAVPTNTVVPTSTSTPAPPTNTPTNTNTPGGGPTNTPTNTPSAACNYTFSTATATPYAGVTNDTGNSCDDCASLLSLPFPVQFYGATYNSVQAYSNGYLEFSAQAQTFAWDGCLPLDTGGQDPPFEQVAYFFNDDLRTDTAACADCGIYTATFGTAPNRVFVVRWHTTYFADESTEANFQAVLTEGSGVLSGIYGTSADSGALAVVGTQYDLTRYAQFQCDQATLTNGLRINFTPVGCALRR